MGHTWQLAGGSGGPGLSPLELGEGGARLCVGGQERREDAEMGAEEGGSLHCVSAVTPLYPGSPHTPTPTPVAVTEVGQ